MFLSRYVPRVSLDCGFRLVEGPRLQGTDVLTAKQSRFKKRLRCGGEAISRRSEKARPDQRPRGIDIGLVVKPGYLRYQRGRYGGVGRFGHHAPLPSR